MEAIVRIERIEIQGVKNVENGHIDFLEYSSIKKGIFNEFKSTTGIYGQNGSGKTTALETISIIKSILEGNKIRDDIQQYINIDTDSAKILIDFYISFGSENHSLVYYECEISKDDIIKEKLSLKKYNFEEKEWNNKITLFEYDNQNISPKTLTSLLSNDALIELKVIKSIKLGYSIIFNENSMKVFEKELNDKFNNFVMLIKALNIYAQAHLIVINNNHIGSSGLFDLIPINIYLGENNIVHTGEMIFSLKGSNEIPINIYPLVEKYISQIDVVLHSIVPTLNLKIINKKSILTREGKEGYSFDIVSFRNNKTIPLEYESEGIKRIISITCALIAAYNNRSVGLFVDELDSGIFEYLLGELIEIFDESAKGQLVFTSHNLRALEKLDYKSIVFTTTNPNNRFMRLKGVKTNNNLRDLYFSNILLGGQNESLYDETANYEIKRAFRKAGKI